jgi:hypothetical protein
MQTIENMDIDAVIATIEYSLIHCKDGAWHIVDGDGETWFSIPNELDAIQEYKTNYIDANQLLALELDAEVWNEMRAEDAANRRIFYTA